MPGGGSGSTIREGKNVRESLKDMVRSGELVAGTFLVEFVTPGIGHILAGAGCDFAFLDMEHSGFSEETVKAGLRFLEAGGIPTLVRIPSREAHDIARIADVGAEGVMLPLIGNVEVAKAAVAALKYPPLGRRGVALRIAHDNYRSAAPAEALAAANDRTVLILMIETAEGVEMPRRSRRWTASTRSGSGISIFRPRSASPASSTIRISARRRGGSAPRRSSMARGSGGW